LEHCDRQSAIDSGSRYGVRSLIFDFLRAFSSCRKRLKEFYWQKQGGPQELSFACGNMPFGNVSEINASTVFLSISP
jgi:hypothetical protein